MKIGIIGAGNMGGAIALGLGNCKSYNASDVCCSDVSESALQKIRQANPEIRVTTDNCQIVNAADIILIAVKPWLVEAVIQEIKPAMDYKKQIIVSIATGVNFETLSRYLEKEGEQTPTLFRVIPNTAVEVKESVNIISSYHATPEQIEVILHLFNELGLSFLVEERLMNAGMALSSCGIAFAFRYIRAAIEGAVEIGLRPELAKEIELQTLKGAITLLKTNNNHPEAEIDKVTTPGGITIKGLNMMEKAGFTNAVIQGLLTVNNG
jgi:pyrroline-5-carboxylate reductase